MLRFGLFFTFLFFFLLAIAVEARYGDSYYKMLGRMHSAGRDPIIASRVPKMDRNCFFSPVQCMLDTSRTIDENF
ncbi:unnamed protein product [Caenorhabditis auriculariae]|uniref:Uncharacterized protein n=1 Tax=Caenorhabditis auriculariae TaxID=2777116 RepID=A0A8S1H9F8_9PELO|nr:unnamed protein product [Caenorhabditis auriculariae]